MARAHITEVIEHLRQTDPARVKKASKGEYWTLCKLNGDCCGACENIKRRVVTDRPGYYEMTPKQLDRELARIANTWQH